MLKKQKSYVIINPTIKKRAKPKKKNFFACTFCLLNYNETIHEKEILMVNTKLARNWQRGGIR